MTCYLGRGGCWLPSFLLTFSLIPQLPFLTLQDWGLMEGRVRGAGKLLLDWLCPELHCYHLMVLDSLILPWISCEAVSQIIQRSPLISHLKFPWPRQTHFIVQLVISCVHSPWEVHLQFLSGGSHWPFRSPYWMGLSSFTHMQSSSP